MAITVDQNSIRRTSIGSQFKIEALATYGLYETGGSLIDAATLGLDQIQSFIANQESGFLIDPEIQTNATGVRLKVFSGTGGFTPAGTISDRSAGTPAGTNSDVSAGTPAGTVSAPLFTGVAPGASATNTIVYQVAPTGNNIHLNYDGTGRAWLEANNNVTNDDGVITFSNSDKMVVKNVAVPAGPQVYFSLGTIFLECVNPFGVTMYLSTVAGGLVPVLHNAAAPDANSQVTVYHDTLLANFRRLEYASTDLANHNISLLGSQAWIAVTPTGTNSAPTFTGAALAPHNHVFAGAAMNVHNHIFSGTPVPAGASGEVANGTNLAAIGPIEIIAMGV